MKKKVGVVLIAVSILLWGFYFIMHYPNAISKHAEISKSGKQAIVVTTILLSALFGCGIFLIKSKPKS